MPRVHLVIEMSDQGGHRRAERWVNFHDVPRVDEEVWATEAMPLRVRGVSWSIRDQTPTCFLGRAAGTPPDVEQLSEGFLSVPHHHVNRLEEHGWRIG
jgi:hypothetical protein